MSQSTSPRLRSEQEEESKDEMLFGDYVHVTTPEPVRKVGTLFIEGRLRDGFFEDSISEDFCGCDEYAKALQSMLTSADNTFEFLDDVLAEERSAILKLQSEYPKAKSILQFLNVVEYVGPSSVETCYSTTKVNVKVHVYAMHVGTKPLDEIDDPIEAGEVVRMPNVRFDGIWDELVFEKDIKADLIWMMTNVLRFSEAFSTNHMRRKLNPSILLYGPPGTGKTSLCQGLAQKISIRLGAKYKSTELVQIKTAVLLSKYFSESAKHVDEIFTKISHMCSEDPETFVCVLIDEVESIAISREYSTKSGESHDSLRATNALLTGLDRTAIYTNVVFLFTSNMYDALEGAFLDRCGLKEFIGPPSISAQYEILRNVLQRLIACDVIQSKVSIPTYDMATYDETISFDLPGPKLVEIVRLIQDANASSEAKISGRSLAQLPEKALMRYLRDDECDGDTALSLMRKCVLETATLQETTTKAAKTKLKVMKRSWGQFLEDDCDTNICEVITTYKAGLEVRQKEACDATKEEAIPHI